MVAEQAGEGEAAEAAPVKSDDNGGKTVAKKVVQQAGEGGASEKSPIKGKGKGGKVVDKDSKTETTGFVGWGKKKSKKSAKEVVIYEDVDEGPLGDAMHGTKRKRTDDDEETEVADDESVKFEDNDAENNFGFHSLGGQLDGAVEI